ncbi:MAG TPA: helix-turn-helix transcriptional regulator [Thermoanaerobaculia bacterium]
MARRKRAQLAPADELQSMERALDLYLESCYRRRERAEVTEFARTLGLARQYVNRRITSLTGDSVLSFIRRKQLQHAKQLLLTTDLPVEQVGILSAFGSGWTFHRLFKAAFGMTPGQFRNEGTKHE